MRRLGSAGGDSQAQAKAAPRPSEEPVTQAAREAPPVEQADEPAFEAGPEDPSAPGAEAVVQEDGYSEAPPEQGVEEDGYGDPPAEEQVLDEGADGAGEEAPPPEPVEWVEGCFPWTRVRNPDDGSVYYFNEETEESTWDPPQPAP